MSERLLEPADAADALVHHLEQSWAERICAELVQRYSEGLLGRAESILMDEAARVRYLHLGVDRDPHGKLLQPSTARLANLTPEEADCYAAIATAGPAATRRIEQERIDLAVAQRAMMLLLARQPS